MILFTYNLLVAKLNHINHSIIMLPVLIFIYSNLYPLWYSNVPLKTNAILWKTFKISLIFILLFQLFISTFHFCCPSPFCSPQFFSRKSAFSSSTFEPFFKAILSDRYEELLKTLLLDSRGNTIMVEKFCHDHIQKSGMRMVLAKQI